MPTHEPSKSYGVDFKREFPRKIFRALSESIEINRPSEPHFSVSIDLAANPKVPSSTALANWKRGIEATVASPAAMRSDDREAQSKSAPL
ncbi:hypothetical protein [Aminobacter sp. MET-1]|uniref:hypothetical protein n=1 Tax=Aminobacter sp. MET-1 TaxID=2951085 RepID=UPI002269C6B8|nr:hypothetical protein [Aminobacter sp. MET-1]MCX8571027.1 hypothetical protein [Aminobacter sp. MET-1]